MASRPLRDLRLARVAKRHGAKWSLRTVREARRAGVPISWGLAMVEQESHWENIFGCDHGPGKAFCHQKVTKAKVQELLRSSLANGVGPTQLTTKDYVRRADRYGGAHIPRHNIRAGMEVLREKTGGDMKQAWKYNGAKQYQAQIEGKARRWHQRFRAAGLAK